MYVVFQSQSCVQLFVTPRTEVHQALLPSSIYSGILFSHKRRKRRKSCHLRPHIWVYLCRKIYTDIRGYRYLPKDMVVSFPLDIYSKLELLDLVLIFWGDFILFSTVTASIYIPPTVYKGSLFSTPSPTFIRCALFNDSHSDRCGVIADCGFDLHFPDD